MSEAANGFLFKCDPAKNIECPKKRCYLNGGDCTMTKHMRYAVDPTKVTMVIPTDAKTLGREEEINDNN